MATKPSRLNPGDAIGFAAAFLRNTGQHTGFVPFMRGRFIAYDDTIAGPGRFARVIWDGAETESLVASGNIARVGSPRFAHSDL